MLSYEIENRWTVSEVSVMLTRFEGVQILAGILAILSAVLLVVFFAKLDDLISRQYFKMFEVSRRRRSLFMSYNSN